MLDSQGCRGGLQAARGVLRALQPPLGGPPRGKERSPWPGACMQMEQARVPGQGKEMGLKSHNNYHPGPSSQLLGIWFPNLCWAHLCVCVFGPPRQEGGSLCTRIFILPTSHDSHITPNRGGWRSPPQNLPLSHPPTAQWPGSRGWSGRDLPWDPGGRLSHLVWTASSHPLLLTTRDHDLNPCGQQPWRTHGEMGDDRDTEAQPPVPLRDSSVGQSPEREIFA